jgi:hypothetical protein
MAIKANLTIDQGTDFNASIDVLDSDGQPFSLQGYSSVAQMRKSYFASSAITFITTENVQESKIILALTSDVTKDIEPGRYVYDVEIRSQSNTVTRVVEGIITVTPGVTRI